MFKPFDIVHEDFFGLRANESAFGLQSILDAAFTPVFAQDFDTALSFPGDIDDINLSFGCACEKHVQGHDHAHDGDGHFDIYPHYHGPDGVALADGGEDNADGTPSVFMEGDVPDNDTTTAVLTVDTPYIGELEVDFDNDWIRFEVVEGQRYQINVDGTGANALEDPLVNIRDQNGNFLASNDDANGSRNSEISFSADYTGVYYIDVSHWENTNGAQPAMGEYTVTAQEVAPLAEYTYDQIADFLTGGSWTERTHDDRDGDASNGTTISYHIADLPAASQALAIAAMQAWADVANINFVEVEIAALGDLRFEDGDDGAYAATSTSTADNITSVRINVSQADWIDTYGTDINSYSYQTYIHEIGHALGLGHGGPYNGSAVYNFNNIYTNDSWATTVMSYFDQGESGFGTARLVLGTQVADIIAIQNLYGANTTTRNGDSVYGFNSTELGSIYDSQNWVDQGIRLPSFSIWDTAGEDTLDFSGYISNQTISLIEETFSSVGDNTNTNADITDALQNVISVAQGTVIENAIGGTGADTITGNAVSNVLTGNAGNDILDGGDGIDYAVFNVAAITDLTIIENADGTFTVTANTGTDGTDTLSNIEFIRVGNEDFALGAEEPDDSINGTPNNDVLVGTNGDDIINGLAGNDTITGGLGNDILEGGGGSDILDGGAGQDMVSYETSTNRVVINMLTDSITSGHATGDTFISIEDIRGTRFADTLTGDRGDNVFYGDGGFDILSGFNGDDTIFGGAGNDFITGGAGADTVDGGTGDDMMRYVGSREAVTVDLEAGTAFGGDAEGDVLTNVERLFGSNHDDTFTGDAQNNWLFGAAGNDTLDGGAGIDKFFGGAGSDTFVFSAGDTYVYVADFQDDVDNLDFSSYGFDTVEDALANMNQFGAHVRFFVDGDTMLILNTTLDAVADDIIIDNGGMV